MGVWPLSDVGDTAIRDLCGNCQPGTFGTGQTWTANATGPAINFAGTGIITVGDYDLVVGDTATWVFQFNPANTTQVAGIINKRTAYNSQQAYSIGLNYRVTNVLTAGIGAGGSSSTECVYEFPASGWAGVENQVILTYDRTRGDTARWKCYRNGLAITAAWVVDADQSIVATTSPIEFGRVNNATLYYTGTLSYMLMFNTALDNYVDQLHARPWAMIWTPGRRCWYGDAGGGTTYYATLSETATVSEVMPRQTQRTLSETATTSETLAWLLSRTLSELATGADALTKLTGRTLSETATASETLTRAVARTLTDTATATDAQSKLLARALSEVLTATDALTASIYSGTTYLLTLSELLTATDGLAKQRLLVLAIAQATTILDAAQATTVLDAAQATTILDAQELS